MASKNRQITIGSWETVSVTALPPGWRNTYRYDDGQLTFGPCPALLLQEHRGNTISWDEPAGEIVRRRTHYEPHDPPYETRVVFADFDSGTAYLAPADDVSNYAGTLAPGEKPAEGPKGAP